MLARMFSSSRIQDRNLCLLLSVMLQDGFWHLLSDHVVVAFVRDGIDGVSVHSTESRQSVVAVSAASDPTCLYSSSCDLCRIDFSADRLKVEVFELGRIACLEHVRRIVIVGSFDVLSNEDERGSLGPDQLHSCWKSNLRSC